MKTAGERVLVVKGDAATDAATGQAVAPLPDPLDDVVVNNRLRRELDHGALAALKLASPDVAHARRRGEGARRHAPTTAMLPAISTALARETDPGDQGVARR